MKNLSFSLLVFGTLFFTGCGGGNSSDSSVAPVNPTEPSNPTVEMLVGGTYYNVDENLLEQDSYIIWKFNDETIDEIQYGANNDVEYSDVIPYNIEGDQIIIFESDRQEEVACDIVFGVDVKSFTISCPFSDGPITLGFWDNLEDAQQHPDKLY